MDDPWDVKSVRQFGQYTSCMKLNGVPLLPPVLSKECRKEMQYYKLLAKEVEKRISILKPYIESDTDSNEDNTDAPEIPDCEQDYELANENIQAECDVDIEKISAITKEKILDETLTSSPLHTELYDLTSRHDLVLETAVTTSPQIIVDFNVEINETGNYNIENTKSTSSIEVPERDYNCIKTRELLTDVETKNIRCKQQKDSILEEIVNFSFSVDNDRFSDSYHESFKQNGPQSINCKSFTGSLNNIHIESAKNAHIVPKLVRQSSYTILNPSPQLLAHLEVQSVNLGVEMSCISMSDSLSNISTLGKKRRSWDLESAKVKWSNMALELKQKDLAKPISNNGRNQGKGQIIKRAASPPRAKSVAAARAKYASLSSKPKTEPIQRARKASPVRGPAITPSNKTIILEEPMSFRTGKECKPVKSVKEPSKTTSHKKEPQSPKSRPKSPMISESDSPAKVREVNKSATPAAIPPFISEPEDPATKVRELYDRIQKQQLIQMASLVEKQKREQILLQQVFEEQNSLLFKQLKTICPKSPAEIKEAWVDKTQEADRGPVSLSQLMNSQSPEQFHSPLTSTLTDSNKYINHCDSVLKKSRDISNSIKKLGKIQNGTKIHSGKTHPEGSRTRTNSPNRKNTPTSRRLNYDTSASSERDFEPILTDRTNDTMADLNVTFTSDSDDCRQYSHNTNHLCEKEVTVIHTSSTPRSAARSTDSAIKCMEQTIQNSINSCALHCKTPVNQPTPRQQAAASKIVAHAKGYLVRRLMKTARVQATVQTIKDALLCALQLHQDREGIRGADVDLHRRLIQQITAACYSLHDTFIASTASERCAMIAADRSRRASLAARPSSIHRHSDIMSQSHSGVFSPRPKRSSNSTASLMTQSNYETYSSEKGGRARYMPSPRRRPWR